MHNVLRPRRMVNLAAEASPRGAAGRGGGRCAWHESDASGHRFDGVGCYWGQGAVLWVDAWSSKLRRGAPGAGQAAAAWNQKARICRHSRIYIRSKKLHQREHHRCKRHLGFDGVDFEVFHYIQKSVVNIRLAPDLKFNLKMWPKGISREIESIMRRFRRHEGKST